MEKFADVLKLFLEKHLVPTMVSIVGAIVLQLMMSNSWIVESIGEKLFFLLAFCSIFLLWKLLISIFSSLFITIKVSQSATFEHEKSNEEAINILNEFVDSLSPSDKDILLTFISNGNRILISPERYTNCDNLLDNPRVVNKTIFAGSTQNIDESKHWLDPSLCDTLRQGFRPASTLYQYRIKDTVFAFFRSAYQRNGKLGNF